MAQTGVTVSDEVVRSYNDFKIRKTASFIMFKIDGGAIVEDSRSESTNFADLVAQLPPTDGRYIVYDKNFTTKDGRPGNKIVFISWIPDNGPVKMKMQYAGSKTAFTNAVGQLAASVNATDLSEVTEEIVIEACRKYA